MNNSKTNNFDKLNLIKLDQDASIVKNKIDLINSINLTESLDLNSHHDKNKNWDCLKMYSTILNSHKEAPFILDAGSGSKPVLLSWIRKSIPYSKLYACDRISKHNKIFDELNINFSIQDMSTTEYPDNFFDFITSVSVIEHGVKLPQFFNEMSRIIKNDGKLLISTDYWHDKIDTSTKFPYEKQFGPMIVFSIEEIKNIIYIAEQNGFTLLGNLNDFIADEKAIYWERMNESYTFAYLPFMK